MRNKKWGHHVLAPDGSTVIMDDNGILQTWQDSQSENLDPNNPVEIDVYLPSTTRVILQTLLRFRLKPFRSYSKAAASGGGQTSGSSSKSTTDISSKTTTTTEDENIDIEGYVFLSGELVDYVQSEYADADSHNHGIPDGTVLAKAGGGSVTYSAFSGSKHTHWLYNHGHFYTAYGHNHGMDHYHGMEHTHQVYDHTHPIQYGIYQGTTPANVTIKVNGIDRTSELGGPFNTDQADLNLTPYMVAGQWNTIEIGSSRLGRIDATVFIQALMAVLPNY